jgi:hypothetical protein
MIMKANRNRVHRPIFRQFKLGFVKEGLGCKREPKGCKIAASAASRGLPDRRKTVISAATYGSHTIAY